MLSYFQPIENSYLFGWFMTWLAFKQIEQICFGQITVLVRTLETKEFITRDDDGGGHDDDGGCHDDDGHDDDGHDDDGDDHHAPIQQPHT